ncbi:uncharacterized protein Dana_GF20681 [Drosophila ananassae]|uniref:Uncharacterized protein n=1 Tax=Drosophila ananassae TaxID=7217 RepID=B3MUE7_DROAN|nr:uncharacterized protein LOC6503376 isoform X1 [Drosophila ananassae]EDV33476.2 uncharacterized protein Dana_GF20681 [Drosophila ananassae]
MDKHMDYRGELRQHFFGSNNISQVNSRTYIPKKNSGNNHSQFMDHSKYQENRKCPHNRGSGLNQGHSPVKRNNHYQKLLNDNEQIPGNARRSGVQMELPPNRRSGHYIDLSKYEEPNYYPHNHGTKMPQKQKTCQRSHYTQNNISQMQYNSRAEYPTSPRYKSNPISKIAYQYDNNVQKPMASFDNGGCGAGGDVADCIIYKNSAFGTTTSSKSEHADDEAEKDTPLNRYAVKTRKKKSFNFIDSARAHCQEVNERYRQSQPYTVARDDLIQTSDSSIKDSKKSGPTQNTATSPQHGDDLRSIVRSQIKIQQVLDHSIRAGISPMNSSPREDTSQNDGFVSTARATKGSPVRYHCDAVNIRYRCQKPSSPDGLHHSTSGSSTKNTKPSQVTVISAKSGGDLRKIVRSQIEVQQDLDASMRAGLSKKGAVQTSAHEKQIPHEFGATYRAANTKNTGKVNMTQPHVDNPTQTSSSIEPIDFTVSADDIVSSKVINPVIQRIQRMYLNTLQEELSIVDYMQRVPKLVSEVYRREAAEKESKN